MTSEIEGLLELAKVGGIGSVVSAVVLYFIIQRAKAPEPDPHDQLKDQIREVHVEVKEDRADLAEFRLEVHGRLTALETRFESKVPR